MYTRSTRRLQAIHGLHFSTGVATPPARVPFTELRGVPVLRSLGEGEIPQPIRMDGVATPPARVPFTELRGVSASCLPSPFGLIPAQKNLPGACFPAFIPRFLPLFAKRTQLVFFLNLFIPRYFHIFQLGSFGKKHPFLESPVPTDVPSPLARSASSSQNIFQTTIAPIPPPHPRVQQNFRLPIIRVPHSSGKRPGLLANPFRSCRRFPVAAGFSLRWPARDS